MEAEPRRRYLRGSQAREDKQAEFLEAFRLIGVRYHAAIAVGVTADQIYDWEEQDPEFAKQVQRAQRSFVDTIELQVFDWIQGHGQVSQGMSRLVEMVLKAKRDEYKDRVELTGQGGGPVKVEKRELHAHFMVEVFRGLAELGIPEDAIEGRAEPVDPPRPIAQARPVPSPELP